MKKNESLDVLRTPNPQCSACLAFRWHTEEETKQFHPKAGTGIDLRSAPHK